MMKPIFVWACLGAIVFGSNLLSEISAEETRPNILLIVADDLCRRDLGYEGNVEVRTPHLDQLCKESMHFQRMFNPATSCSPTRHALYTGLFPIRSGAYPNHTRVYDGTESLFTLLKAYGYRVALQNKSHVGPSDSFPFEPISGGDDYSETKKFLVRDPTQPWFLVFGSNDPHEPWDRGIEYDPKQIRVPSYLHDNATTRDCLARYYGEISKLDEQVGNLLQLLKETEQSSRTIVIFVSEQGSSMPYGGKWSLYDNGIHSSTLIRWPGKVLPGTKSTALVQYVDIAPTLLDAIGIAPGKIDTKCPDADGKLGFDGISFLDLLLGRKELHRKFVFAQHTTLGTIGAQSPYPMRSVRSDRYKLILNLVPENTYSITGYTNRSCLHLGKKTPRPTRSWQLASSGSIIALRRSSMISTTTRSKRRIWQAMSDTLPSKHRCAKNSWNGCGNKRTTACKPKGWPRNGKARASRIKPGLNKSEGSPDVYVGNGVCDGQEEANPIKGFALTPPHLASCT